ncbi:aminotransferase class III-fold pyridoxal phosphate-dependent enzyme [Roseomonas terrae]|uniref:Aminotransferase class III-fold pyridoxal phosphate-dependent enzyme n=1 Tax=Neoroseomonas terrae TaxID=424799 RepID=A0ABS5EII1_9PROT|nr:aminotransferase class III-fold pyridoxal phosphate-dependent enzyme [Neoroseomonas terrae]MBR0650838.1 aminotransferase class III-fold pyridoxal phosphate-dependent enzyme [Neoroseomonas terrae]
MLSRSNSPIVAAYVEATPGSAALHAQAAQRLPSGVVHDSRYTDPYPMYTERATGPRKWDVDGREIVDFYGGHGALILGHCHPDITAAAQRQLALGTHFGSCHALEVEWAGLIQEMVPCAERVRFTSSGTEATHMALRLARAFTGKPRILRFQRHFHGWHDHMAFGVDGHFDGSPTPGVLPEIAAEVLLVPPGDIAAVEQALDEHDDIAAVIIEPTGASTGAVPVSAEFLHGLRALTRQHGVVLIFDEVVTGFRVSPGGAQGALGVTPDLCTLAKIVAGGLPGGAVAGRWEILDWLDFDAAAASGREKIKHQGTYNANPVSAAAAIAALTLIRDGDVCERATAAAQALRVAFNQVLVEEGIPWSVYGEHSVLHFFTNPQGMRIDPLDFDAMAQPASVLASDPRKTMLAKLYLALVLNGIDPKGSRGLILSATHGQAEQDWAVAGWRRALRMLKAEEEVGARVAEAVR